MSTQSLSDIADITRTESCNYPHCEDSYEYEEGHPHAPFCSEFCTYRATALGIFEDIKHDRRFCANSYHQIRTEEEPGRFMRSSKVRADVFYQKRDNRQYPVRTKDPEDPYAYFRDDSNRHAATTISTPTKHTIRGDGGQREVALSDPHPDSDWTPADSSSAVYCVCGVEDHRTVDRPVKLDPLMEHAKRLSSVVAKLHAEGGHEYEHDRDVLLDTVRERKTDPSDHSPDQHILVDAIAEAIRAEDTDN